MSKISIIRAWKDESYLAQLSEEERNSLPGNPAGLVELDDDILVGAVGQTTQVCVSIGLSIAASHAVGCHPVNPVTVANGTCKGRTKGCC